jgi:hypothetical protein
MVRQCGSTGAGPLGAYFLSAGELKNLSVFSNSTIPEKV